MLIVFGLVASMVGVVGGTEAMTWLVLLLGFSGMGGNVLNLLASSFFNLTLCPAIFGDLFPNTISLV